MTEPQVTHMHYPQHSVRVDRIRDHENPGRLQPADIARLAREAATDIDRAFPVEGLRRLVAIGGLAQVLGEPDGDRTVTDTAFLTQDGLSEFDLEHLTEIIRDEYGTWFHARLMRALHMVLPYADAQNLSRLESAFPGSVAAYRIWYNDPSVEGRAA